MKHRDRSIVLSIVSRTLVLAVVSLTAPFLVGCSGEEEVAVVQPPPPPPPAPEKPRVTPIADLMAQLNIDPRVVLPEDKAPDNDVDRKAILTFFDAFARGNSNDVRTLIAMTDQIELDDLVKTGEWKSATTNIEKIEIQTGTSPYSQKCALAVFHVMGSFQPQLWYYTTDADTEVGAFEAAPSPPGIINELHGDWIAAWHKILEGEIALAEKPDEEIIIPRKSLDENDPSSGAGPGGRGGGGGGLRNPGGGGAPMRPPGPSGPSPGGR